MMFRSVIFLLTVALWMATDLPVFAAPDIVVFRPNVTDSAIINFNDRHYAAVDPAVTQQGLLVVFLPGTGAVPFNYSEFIRNAASLGFNALGLMYPNGSAINELCVQNAPLDPDAAGNARLEVIDGTNRVSFLEVDRANSIENRLIKALQHLHTNNPDKGWNQFFAADTVLWDKIILCGHSQGAGMAGMMAKTRFVNRCVMFTDMDWWQFGNRPYNWMSTSSQTPLNRWFMLAHERDQFLPFTNMLAAASALGIDHYGACVQVETSDSTNFYGRHFLSTNLEPSTNAPTSYHGMPVVDTAIPYQPDGKTPVLKPAWDYLLLYSTVPPPAFISSAAIATGTMSFAISNLTETATNRVLRCYDLLSPVWSTACTFTATSGQTNWTEPLSNQWEKVFYKIESE